MNCSRSRKIPNLTTTGSDELYRCCRNVIWDLGGGGGTEPPTSCAFYSLFPPLSLVVPVSLCYSIAKCYIMFEFSLNFSQYPPSWEILLLTTFSYPASCALPTLYSSGLPPTAPSTRATCTCMYIISVEFFGLNLRHPLNRESTECVHRDVCSHRLQILSVSRINQCTKPATSQSTATRGSSGTVNGAQSTAAGAKTTRGAYS